LHDATGASTIRPMNPTTSSRRQLLFATVAVLALASAACRRGRAVAAPAPDTVRAVEAGPPPLTTAQDLVQGMRDRYAGKWYSTLTFVQTSTYFRPDGSVLRSETWPESAMIPGRLRIDIGNPSLGNAVIYANDTVYSFQQRRLTNRQPGTNPLMILGFDVYHLTPSRTIELLSGYGYDVSTMHRSTQEGRDYYVVGARAEDLRRKQFWIDADRMLLWRVMEPWVPTDTVNVREIRFQDYKQHGGGWVAEEVDFLKNGTRYFFEKYRDVRTDVEIDPALFDPRQFTTAKHWYKPTSTTGTRP
jgi:hypothetical protein